MQPAAGACCFDSRTKPSSLMIDIARQGLFKYMLIKDKYERC